MEDGSRNAALVLLFSFITLAAFWRLPQSPATWFDEGINLGIAKNLVTHGVYSLEVAPHAFVEDRQFLITTNYPVLLPAALSIKLFGFNLAAARLPMAIFLILFALAAYALAKRLYSKDAAIMSVALIASFAPFYGNGKAVLGEVPGLFYLLTGLLFLRGAAGRKRLFLAGLFFGLSAATKPFFLVALAAVVVGEIVMHRKNAAVCLKKCGTILCGAAPPLLIWFISIFPDFSFARIAAAASYYANSYGAGDFLALVAGNLMRFVSETTPLHFLFLALVVCSGIWRRRRKDGENFSAAEIILLVFVAITFAWYLKTPGWYRYFFPAHLILLVLFPGTLGMLLKRRAVIAIAGILFMVQAGHLISQRNENLYNSREATRFSALVMEMTPPGSRLLIVNAPSVAFLLAGREIYQHLRINQSLFFGEGDPAGRGIPPYDYVILNGSPEDALIPGLQERLASSYAPIAEDGHYTLYQRP